MGLTEERLQAAFGQRAIHFYTQTGSTNDHAVSWLTGGAPPSGSFVIADEQTHGRGRLGRRWYAPAGTALMFSYILRPTPDELPAVGMMGALAVCEMVEALSAPALRPRIKWPNDVQIDGRKLCGVLPEACWQGGQLIGAALGIGLNVRVDFTDTEFASSAISLETVAGALDRLDILRRLVERLDDWSARLGSEALYRAWRDRLSILGLPVSIFNGGDSIAGIAEDVDRNGALLIRDGGGTLRRIIAGDIALG